MVDAGLIWKDGKADLVLNDANNDLQDENELKTAIIVSLFTDARAELEQVPTPNSDRRGWWGASIGSLLWLLQRAKATESNLQIAISYIKNALAWLIAQEIASDIAVEGEIQDRVRFSFNIKIKRSNNSKYDYLFKDINTERYDFNRSTYLILFE